MANGEFKRASEMIERAVAADSQFAEGRHVDLANWLVLGANWRLISELLPGRTNSLLTGGWLNSLEHGRPADAEGGMLPWMTYAAIDFLEGVLAPDWRVFEWGSGTSTAWWSGRVAAIHAVEHDRQYYDQVADFGLANLTLRLCEQTEDYVGAISSAASGSLDANAASGPLDANAASGPLDASAAGGPFDAIIIDGEAREACAHAAPAHLKPGGILVFDDSDRAAYRHSLLHLRDAGLKRIDFFGLGPSFLYRKCTSVFFFDDAILQRAPLPGDKQSCLGPTISQAMEE